MEYSFSNTTELYRKSGYNMNKGGDIPSYGRIISKEIREKMRISAKLRGISTKQQEVMRLNKIGKFPITGKRIKKINQYTLDNKFIQSFNSISEASRSTNILRTSISNYVNNRSNFSGNYIWREVK